ncbi:hypothetical protein D3C72_410090 [compost metagenome]
MIAADKTNRVAQPLDTDLLTGAHEHMRARRGHDFAVGLLIVRHGNTDRRQPQRRPLPTGAAPGADKQISFGHALVEVADKTVQTPVRPCLGQGLHLGPCRVIGACDEVHLQLGKVRQREHRVVGLPRGIETTEIDQYPSRRGFDLDGRAAEFFTQHGIAWAEQGATPFRQQRLIIFVQAREILIEQQIDAVAPRSKIIHCRNPWCPPSSSRLPLVIEAVVIDNDPVEFGVPLEHRSQRVDVGLPRQH